MESMGGRLGRQDKAKWDISETGNEALSGEAGTQTQVSLASGPAKILEWEGLNEGIFVIVHQVTVAWWEKSKKPGARGLIPALTHFIHSFNQSFIQQVCSEHLLL